MGLGETQLSLFSTKYFRYTEKADVYSFGINLWEFCTRSIPFSGMAPVQVGIAVLTKQLRPSIPDSCPPAYSQLIQECWHQDPSNRPSFREILERLGEMSRLVNSSTQNAHDC